MQKALLLETVVPKLSEPLVRNKRAYEVASVSGNVDFLREVHFLDQLDESWLIPEIVKPWFDSHENEFPRPLLVR